MKLELKSMTFNVLLSFCMALLPATLLSERAQAQDNYPSRTITLVVPYPPGGATDMIARFIAEKLQKSWGQPVVVISKPGASGIIGANFVMQAPPDGYTILYGVTSLIQQPAMMDKLPYDPLKDLIPLAQTASTSNVFVVPLKSPAKSLQEFLALAKADPGKYNYGSWGNGGSAHIHGELLNQQAGVNLVHVPFQGTGPLVANLLGGHIDSAFVDIAPIMPYIASVRPLAVTGPTRLPGLPDVPTFAELGYHSFEPRGWHGIFVRAGTPPAIVQKLSTEFMRILKLPDTIKHIEQIGMFPAGGSPEDFAALMRVDAGIYAGIVKAAGIKLNQ